MHPWNILLPLQEAEVLNKRVAIFHTTSTSRLGADVVLKVSRHLSKVPLTLHINARSLQSMLHLVRAAIENWQGKRKNKSPRQFKAPATQFFLFE
jgi:hypothetical protein